MNGNKHLNFTSLREAVGDYFSQIKDWRQSSKVNHSIHDALMSGFACMYYQDPSLLQFQKNLQEAENRNNLQTMFNVESIPKETQMREIIDAVDSEHFRPIFKNIYSRLQRGKRLEQYQIMPNKYYFAVDGSQFFSSKEVRCEHCLTREYTEGVKTYSHQVLQGGIMHPDCSEVIPFMPEQIINSDGAKKQDCEINALKRFVKKLHKEFPKLKLLLGGDALFSNQPVIEAVRAENMDYLFVAKPGDHTYMMEWLAYEPLQKIEFLDEKNRTHLYEWENNVPINGSDDTIFVNYVSCKIIGLNKAGEEGILYKNSWVTDLEINEENIRVLVRAGRCRWKSENEIFNVMKNHGYYMEHSYGHGSKNLAFNFYLLTLLAFYFHQIFELTSNLYKANRKKHGSKTNFWNKLRTYIGILIFDSFDALLEFALKPTSFRAVPIAMPP